MKVDASSPMLDAFMSSQKYTDKEASDIEIEKNKVHQDRVKEAYEQLGRSQNISDYMDVSGNVTKEDIEQSTKSHPHFENYDHSLERVRTEEDMKIPEPEPEGFRLLPRGIPNIIDNGEVVDYNDIPDFGIDWGSVGDKLGL